MVSEKGSDGVDPRLEIWREPVRGSYPDPALFALSGIDRLRASLAGKSPLPPLNHLVGMRLTEVGPGKATFTMPASPWLVSPHGGITVGMLAILADGPLGCAVQTGLPPYTVFTTSELSLRVVRPAQVGTILTAKGRSVYGGRSVALSEVAIEDQKGRLIAHRSSLCFVFPPTPAAPTSQSEPLLVPEAKYSTPDPYLRPVIGGPRPQGLGQLSGPMPASDACTAGNGPARGRSAADVGARVRERHVVAGRHGRSAARVCVQPVSPRVVASRQPDCARQSRQQR